MPRFEAAIGRADSLSPWSLLALFGVAVSVGSIATADEPHPDDLVPFCIVGHGLEGGGGVGPLPITNTFLESEMNDTLETAQVVLANKDERTAVDGAIQSAGDVDFYSFSLERGDVVQFYVESLSPDHSVELKLYDAKDNVVLTARTDVLAAPVFVAPNAPFITSPGDDVADLSASLIWVVQETRDVVIRVASDDEFGSEETGDYRINVTPVRSPIESAPPGTALTVFLDFDGAMITMGDIYNPAPGPDPISPLADFLPAWGLEASDEDAVIDAIIAQIQLRIDDLERLNPNFAYNLTNSRDHADTFGEPWTTRLIIGGTRDELGISVIGIAESIDVGDFAPNQTAFLLLDIISSETSSNSVNNIPRAEGFSIIDAIGQAVGITASHELGHNIGGVHTSNSNTTRSVMDAGGGNIPLNLYGVGPDGEFGTEDDEVILFSNDEYIGSGPNSSLEGFEPTNYVAAIAFGSPTGCAADLNGDGFVNGTDLASLLANWGPAKGGADFNGDGMVNGADLAALLSVWGDC